MPTAPETAQPSIPPTSVPSPSALAPLEATMSQLTDQFSRMTLMLQAHLPALQETGTYCITTMFHVQQLLAHPSPLVAATVDLFVVTWWLWWLWWWATLATTCLSLV